MELRKKPIPNPLPRGTTVRAVVAARTHRALPTVAALLAATSLLACTSTQAEIAADQQVMQATLRAAPTVTLEPPPGMGALESEAEPPKVDPVITAKPRPPIVKPPHMSVVTGGAPPPVIPKHAGVKPPVRPSTI